MSTITPIYLDHNATTPLLPEVVDAMLPWLTTHFGNPSSSHARGQQAKAGVEQARAQVAALLDCDASEVVFTSGGTEANNLAIRGISGRRNVVTSVIEHPATARPCDWLERHGARVDRARVDGNGVVSIEDIRAAANPETALVSVMHSNNETGVLQPIAELAKVAHAVGALMHTDAAQSLGKVPVSVRQLGVDLLSVAGHKLYAPKGVGALFIRRGVTVSPLVLGAGHERGIRPGTENVASIVGLGAACALVQRNLDEEAARVRQLRDTLWNLLAAAVPGIALNGHAERRLPNTLNVRFPSVGGTALLDATPGVEASTGSACHDGHEAASAVILAMGVPPQEAAGSVRLTLGRGTTVDQVERAAAALVAGWRSCPTR